MDLSNTSERNQDDPPVEIHSEALIQASKIVPPRPQHVQLHSTTVTSPVTSDNVFLNHSTSNSEKLNEVLAEFGPEFPKVELGAAFDDVQAPSDGDIGPPKTNLNRVMHSNVSEFVEKNHEGIGPTRNNNGLEKQENSTITVDGAVAIKGQLESKPVFLEIGEKPFKCESCNHTFIQKHHLKRHQLIHSGEKPYECKNCNYACRDRSSLTRHQRTHSGERPFKCKQCNSSYSDRSSLRSHERVHSGERPFTCKQCNSSYSDRSNLRSHQRVHSDERPFICDICKMSFRRKNDLKVHMYIHSRKKSHKCNECKKKFSRRFSLKRHLPIHSKKKAAQP